jgi:hypothetical protein
MDLKQSIKKDGRMWKGQSGIVYSQNGIAPTLYAKGTGKTGGNTPIINASGQTTTTNMPAPSIDTTMEIKNSLKPTYVQSTLTPSQTTISSRRVSLVRAFQSLDGNLDSKTLEVRFFLRSFGFSKQKDPDIFYSKTFGVYLVLTLEKLSRQFLGFSPTKGITWHGRVLIQKTSEFPKIAPVSSLLDILQTPNEVDEKYFLSSQQMKWINEKLRNKDNEAYAGWKSVTHLMPTIGKDQTANEP